MNNTGADFTWNVQITLNPLEQNKSLYGDGDQRLNLPELESKKLEISLISLVKKQAESIACLVLKDTLIKKEEGWQFHPMTPTLSQTIERQFQAENVSFGEQEAFKDELAPGFGTAFLVGERLALTSAHCVCVKDSDILDQKVIEQARLIFGFHEINGKPSDYFFANNKVYHIKKVVAHQFTRIRDKSNSYTEWTDWALLELNEEVPFTPLRMNMTEKVADKIELYMLGHPSGLPLKFTGGGFVQGNTHKDFFECNLDAFGGNSGSFVAAASTKLGSGMLCSGGTDYEITDNYKNTGKRRIQACRITRSQILQKEIGARLENCQRVDTLRFLVSPKLLGLEELKQPGSPLLVVKALQDNYRSRNTIPRLLYSALLIEEVYTELVLLEKEKEEKMAAFEEQRINSWEDVRGSKTPIELKNLFNTDGKVQKKLLILGKAGIGKSILCQYIAYQWSLRKMWPGKFDALFWVPLRKLQHAHSAETVASFLFRVCCQEHGPALYPKDIADYLKQNGERILLVLDGLDEVSMEEGSLQKGIVDELLRFPHWVLTSRPHAAALIEADATIENVGFASKTIDAYIKKSFPTNSQAMIQTIRQNPMILGLCHIPINIELVCSILQKAKGNISFIRSMSGLYEELTLILQRRFLDKLGKPSAWYWEPEDIEKDAEISLVFKSLESVAWEGMKEKALFFSFNQGAMKKIYCNSYPSFQAEKREPLFKNMCASGFLQSTGDNPLFLHNEYSFLHLTFQEFFAAQYLARLLQDNPKEAAKCIEGVKFDPRYKVVMWFVAGLLRNEGGDFRVLNAFFEILDTPKDLVGLYGALLKVRCMEECGWQKELQKIKVYEEETRFWLGKMGITDEYDPLRTHLIETFKISPQGDQELFIPKFGSWFSNNKGCFRKAITYAHEQVDHANLQAVISALLVALKDEKYEVRIAAIQSLEQIGHANPQAVIPALLEVRKDEKYEVCIAARKSLEQIGHANPQAAIPALLEALKDEDEGVRRQAADVLGLVGHANSQAVIPALLEALKNKREFVRNGVKEALGQLVQADPQVVIPALLETLKDEDGGVRHDAAEVLGLVGHGDSQAVIPALLEALEDKAQWVRMAATEALGRVGHADPKAVIPALIEAFKNEKALVRFTVTAALGRVGPADPQTIIPALLEALKDENEGVRHDAAEVLGLVGHGDSQAVIPALLEALEDKAQWVRKAATEALGRVGHADPKAVIPALIEWLKDEDWSVRHVAIKALGQVGQADPNAVIPTLLEAALKHDITAKQALQKFDLSFYLKSQPNILNSWKTLLTSTPLTSLITCYKKDRSQPSVYSAAITKKCIEENLPIFQIENAFCCFEQSKLCTVDFPNANHLTIQIEKRIHEYPEFVFTQSSNQIQEPEPSITQTQNQLQQNQKDNEEKTEICAIQ
jgi:HEAT repeat protein/V8-like Glu-specific endopeptidase